MTDLRFNVTDGTADTWSMDYVLSLDLLLAKGLSNITQAGLLGSGTLADITDHTWDDKLRLIIHVLQSMLKFILLD